jgi:hypothetical protein
VARLEIFNRMKEETTLNQSVSLDGFYCPCTNYASKQINGFVSLIVVQNFQSLNKNTS